MSPLLQRPPRLCFIVVLLCFGTVFQMLGVPLTFGYLDGSSDILQSSMFEGLTLISSEPNLSLSSQRLLPVTIDRSTYKLCLIAFFFRPPNNF